MSFSREKPLLALFDLAGGTVLITGASRLVDDHVLPADGAMSVSL